MNSEGGQLFLCPSIQLRVDIAVGQGCLEIGQAIGTKLAIIEHVAFERSLEEMQDGVL